MPLMTPEELHRFLETEFSQAPPGIVVESVDDTTIRVRQKTEDRHLRPGGTISGPTLLAMVDCGFYLLLLSRLGPVAMAVTTNLNINFMRKPDPGHLVGEGRLLSSAGLWRWATSPSGTRAKRTRWHMLPLPIRFRRSANDLVSRYHNTSILSLCNFTIITGHLTFARGTTRSAASRKKEP